MDAAKRENDGDGTEPDAKEVVKRYGIRMVGGGQSEWEDVYGI